jgi:hypothetical protein
MRVRIPIICQCIPVCCLFCLCFSIYRQLAKSLFPPLFFPVLFLIFEWFVSTSYFNYFKSCSCPFNTRHHLPHFSSIMVLTRRSIISQPNRASTCSCSSLVPVFFALSKNNTSSFYSIDHCSGFCRVCPDFTIFFLFCLYLLQATFFGLSTQMTSTNFPSSFFVLISFFKKASPVNVNYITTVSSSSPSTPLWSGNHPTSNPDSDKTIPLPPPLQQLLDWYIAVHCREPPQPDLDEKFHVKFGFKCIRCVKIKTLHFTG